MREGKKEEEEMGKKSVIFPHSSFSHRVGMRHFYPEGSIYIQCICVCVCVLKEGVREQLQQGCCVASVS